LIPVRQSIILLGKSINVEEKSTSIRGSAAQNGVPIFLLLKEIVLGGVSRALFCDAFHGLSLFHTKVMKTYTITVTLL
jgi:hypothetical protein